MRRLSDHVGLETKPNGPRAKTTGRATKKTLRNKNENPPQQVSKYLELPETRHNAAVIVDKVVAVVDIEAPGGKTPNNGKPAIHHLLAAREDQWMIPKEPLSLTDMVHQNSGRRFQDTG